MFCAQHAGLEPTTLRGEGHAPGLHTGKWLERLRNTPSRNVVPDEAKFPVPSWLESSPLPRVIECLRDPSPTTRWLAAFTLRKRRDPAAIEPLWEMLQSEAYGLIRQQAAVALGKIGTRAALGPLVEALWHDKDPGVRQACAVALGNLHDSTVMDDLSHVLEHEAAGWVRWDCILALGAVGDRTVEPLLLHLSGQERAESLRRACQEAIAAIRQRAQRTSRKTA